MAELQVALATESARLVDDVRDSDASASTRTDLFSEHRQQISDLRKAIPPVPPPNPLDAIEKALLESMTPEHAPDDDVPDWDEAERQLIANPRTWPEPPEPGQLW
jgi:hypothetical protein